jgi:hypothetical protein
VVGCLKLLDGAAELDSGSEKAAKEVIPSKTPMPAIKKNRRPFETRAAVLLIRLACCFFRLLTDCTVQTIIFSNATAKEKSSF